MTAFINSAKHYIYCFVFVYVLSLTMAFSSFIMLLFSVLLYTLHYETYY